MKVDLAVGTAIKLIVGALCLLMAFFTYFGVMLWYDTVINVAVSAVFCIGLMLTVIFIDLCILRFMAWATEAVRGHYARKR